VRQSEDPDEPPEALVVRACPDCRAPLRDIHRYNRIVKVAYLDESTRRFCIIAQENYVKLYKNISDAQVLLEANRDDFLRRYRQRATRRAVAPQRFPIPIDDRIQRVLGILNTIYTFAWTVAEQEQPYIKVRDMVLNQRRRDLTGVSTPFLINNSLVQTGFRLKAFILFIEFKWDSLWDLHIIAGGDLADSAGVTQRKLRRWILKEIPQAHYMCSQLIDDCRGANMEKYEVQVRIGRAQFFALHRLETNLLNQAQGQANPPIPVQHEPQGPGSWFGEEGFREENESLNRCDTLCRQKPGTVGPLQSKVDGARKLLQGETFYAPVTAEEKAAVYLAMAAQFSSTGRWYTCENGHPFTIGDCGAPNQLATCPECGAGIGGDYRSGLTAGVRPASDFVQLDERFRSLRLQR